MCGIAGLFNLRGDAIDTSLLRRMTTALTHRGPEATAVWVRGEGLWHGGGSRREAAGDPTGHSDERAAVGLGHTRLRIIDVEGGDQPIWNEDGSCLVVFNGEIYNFQELRRDLEGRGHVFVTHTDTEVIVHAYEAWGEACVERFQGMFAFALWDERRHALFLARDRLGIKPLHLAWQGPRLAFASELKALIQDPALDREVDPAALEAYLALGYVPGPGTLLRGVTTVPAGHSLLLELGKPIGAPRRYWQVPVGAAKRQAGTRAAGGQRSEAECLEELDELLREVVGRHLMSDVPLGVFLSGGVDSSALVAVASRLSKAPVRTFSIGFPESASYNEAPHAREVALRFGTEHRECMLTPDALDVLPQLAWQLDQPLADPSAIALFVLCRMTREHVSVALAGDGGDELFGGYERYYWDQAAARYASLPLPLRAGLIEPALRLLLPRLPLDVRKDPFRRARKFVRYAGLPAASRYFHWFELMTPEFRRELGFLERDGNRCEPVGSHPSSSFDQAFADAMARGASPLDAMQYCDTQTMLRDDLLHKCDRVSLAVSLEARVPFLDHLLVEWAFGLPDEMRVRGRTLKYLLKRWLSRHLPERLIYRRKQGFEVPVYDWLTGSNGSIARGQEMMRDLLLDRSAWVDGPFRPEGVRSLVERLESGERVLALPVYSLLIWQLWKRQYLEAPVAAAGV